MGSLRSAASSLAPDGVAVFGISVDSVNDLKAFHEAEDLTYPLLSDASRSAARAYGVLSPRGYASRRTFVIDPRGIVLHVFEQVDVPGHGDEVMEVLERLRAQPGAPAQPVPLDLAASRWGVRIEPNQERITLDVVDTARDEVRGSGLKPDHLPILVEGTQVASFQDLRRRLRTLADPTRFPAKTRPDGSPMPPLRPGLYPSRKPLLIRCDRTAIFGWVRAVMQCCTFIPGRDPQRELEQSPFIYRISLGVMGDRHLVSWLPVDTGLPAPGAERKGAELILRTATSEWEKPAPERVVTILRAGSDEPLGRATGVPLAAGARPRYTAGALEAVRGYLKAARESDPDTRLKLNSWFRVPHACVIEMLGLGIEAGFSDIRYSDIPGRLLKDLESGGIR